MPALITNVGKVSVPELGMCFTSSRPRRIRCHLERHFCNFILVHCFVSACATVSLRINWLRRGLSFLFLEQPLHPARCYCTCHCTAAV